MGQKTESPHLFLVASRPETRDRKLARQASFVLEQCRAMLVEGGEHDTVRLLDIALLQLRMSLRGVSDAELKEFCAALAVQGDAARMYDGV